MRAAPFIAGSALCLSLGLAACGNAPATEAPSDSEAVEDRAVRQQKAKRRTGAEIQELALNRVVQAVYVCDNSERLTVDFDNPRQMATVRNSNGLAVDLHQQRTDEGIWYTASGYELRGQGIHAAWQARNEEPTNCRAVD